LNVAARAADASREVTQRWPGGPALRFLQAWGLFPGIRVAGSSSGFIRTSSTTFSLSCPRVNLFFSSPSSRQAVLRRVSPSGSCGSATVSDELADTTSELDDFSFSMDVKLNLVVTRGRVIHGFL
jgi:hypothetical protein